MKIDIRGHQIALTETLRAYIERRLQFALGRFGTRITTVNVTLEDLNGPRGGVDKQCCITATLATAGNLRAEARATEITQAVNQAADRIVRIIARECERRYPYPTYRPSVVRVSGAAVFGRRSRTSGQRDAA